MVSKARLDFPEPDSPVKTISASRGRSRWTSLRLCSRAPRTTRRSNVIPVGQPGRPVAPGPRWRCQDVDTGNAVTARAQSVTTATLPLAGCSDGSRGRRSGGVEDGRVTAPGQPTLQLSGQPE